MDGIITLNNAIDDQVNLKYAIHNFKKYTKSRIQEKKNEKEHKNVEELLTGGQWVFNAFENGIFSMKNITIIDDDHYIYDDELYPDKNINKSINTKNSSNCTNNNRTTIKSINSRKRN